MVPENRQSSENTLLRPGAEPVAGYPLLQRLGGGGFGEVWKAAAPGGFKVALKFVRLEGRAATAELRALELIKDIRHPNLLSLFGAWHAAGFLVVAMELADRALLDRFDEVLRQGLPGIPNPELLTYMAGAAQGIDFLNEPRHVLGGGPPVGIQHRDIKPPNLLLVGGGVKVADFGLARLLEHSVTSHTGSMTLAYAAPEFFEGKTSQHSDQYSLAVAYCQLRGGELPFGGNAAQLTAGHLMLPPDLSMLPEPERPAVARALAKKPEERWPNCRTFVTALQQAGRGKLATPTARGVAATRLPRSTGPATMKATAAAPPDTFANLGTTVVPPSARPPGSSSRGWMLWVGSGAALVLAVGLLLWATGFWRSSRKEGEHPVDDVSTARSEAVAHENDTKRIGPGSGPPGGGNVNPAPPQPPGGGPPGGSLNSAPRPPGGGPPGGGSLNSAPRPPGGNPVLPAGKGESPPAAAANPEREPLAPVRLFKGHRDFVRSVAFSPDGKRAVSASGGIIVNGEWAKGTDHTVRIWDVETGAQVHQLAGHDYWVLGAAFCGDQMALSASWDKTVRFWNTELGTAMGRPFRGHTEQVNCVTWLREGSRLLVLSAGWDRTPLVWDAQTGAILHRLRGHADYVLTAAFSPDGKKALSAGGGEFNGEEWLNGSDFAVRVWDWKNGRELRRLTGHTAWVEQVTFSPDGGKVLSASLDNTMRLWDAESGKQLHRFEHPDLVNSAVFLPNGKHALSGCSDQLVRLWDLDTGKELARLKDHTDAVMSVAVSPDGRYALSGGNDKTLRLWKLP